MARKLSGKYIAGFVDGEGCFDLQFRRDVRRDRPGSPIYYSWKSQFVINLRKDDLELLEQIKDVFQCGTIHLVSGFARYSVQDIDTLLRVVVLFFQKYQLHGKKQNDFALWAEAIEILFQNQNKRNIQTGTKGFTSTQWHKKDFQRLIDIQKEMQQYKAKRPQGVKWISAAETIAATLPE